MSPLVMIRPGTTLYVAISCHSILSMSDMCTVIALFSIRSLTHSYPLLFASLLLCLFVNGHICFYL
jgi:hypothetical protein